MVQKIDENSNCCKKEADILKDCCSEMDENVNFFDHKEVSFSKTSCGYEFIAHGTDLYSIPKTIDLNLFSSSIRISDSNLHLPSESLSNNIKAVNCFFQETPIYKVNSNFRI